MHVNLHVMKEAESHIKASLASAINASLVAYFLLLLILILMVFAMPAR